MNIKNIRKAYPIPLLALILIGILSINPINVQALNTYSMDFEDGSSEYLSISDTSQAGLDLSDDLTIEAWVKAESLTGDHFIVNKGQFSDDTQQYLLWIENSGLIDFRVSDDGSNSDTHAITWNSNTGVITTGSWIHIAVTFDISSESAALYINGNPVTFTKVNGSTIGSTLNNGSRDFVLGARENSGSISSHFDGLIDEVRIWNIARTETEINDDKDRELNGNETGLIAYWKLNNSANDTTSSNNDLDTSNGGTFVATTPFSGFTEDLSVRKSANQSLSNSSILQSDDDLKLSLAANKTYAIDGVVFASSTSAAPDIKIAFYGQTGSDVRIGYTNDVNELVLFSGDESSNIQLTANTPTSIHLKGTVTTSSTSGELQLKWAQGSSNAAAVTVMEGSYLKAEEI